MTGPIVTSPRRTSLRTFSRRAFASLALLGLVAACVTVPGGRPGTGPIVNGGGENEGGIGGTGIVGTVTGFGSIRVNGFRVEMPDAAPVFSVLGDRRFDSIALGETVAVIARGEAEAAVSGQAASLRFPVIGTVSEFKGLTMRVLGVPVLLETGAAIVAPGKDGGLRPGVIGDGDRVAVSGLWRGSMVVASRVEVLPREQTISGTAGILRRSADGRFRIGGTPILIAPDVTPPEAGQRVHAIGREGSGGLTVTRFFPDLMEEERQSIRDLSVEGYLATLPLSVAAGEEGSRGLGGTGITDTGITGTGITGTGITDTGLEGLSQPIDPGSKVQTLLGERALFIGALGSTFEVRHGVLLPASAEARRQQVNAIENGLFPANAIETQ